MRVGFIGMGLMGIPMSKNILEKGFELTVYNRTKEKTKELFDLGAKVVDSPMDLTRVVDVVITMVTAGRDLELILFGDNGVVNGANEGLIVVDMSTIGPSFAKNIALKLSQKRIDFIDAPVTGSTPKAITGNLTIFIGGDEKIYEKIKSILASIGNNLQYMGPIGCGQAIKLINNHLIATSIESLAEGMLLADAMGLSRKKVSDVLKTSPAMSEFMNLKIFNFVTDDFPLLFSVSNMMKDLLLANKEAKKNSIKLPMLDKIVDIYRKVIKKGLGDRDMSIIIDLLKK
ncbi:MAG: NAD(P)-dependent oxidoreductase [Candidatus Levybacteria bacterium]|nr:NAD(P)-dependent oxidoreductase [Candidatus Levybacteria bacterium]